MRWEDVLRRDDIVGGDIEVQREGTVLRGPIRQIHLAGRGNRVFFETWWTAKMVDGTWKNFSPFASSFSAADAPPREIGDGCIQFNTQLLGTGVIFPKGGSQLDPAKVEGLELART